MSTSAESSVLDKDGIFWKRAGSSAKKRRVGQKKWNSYYFNLVGGSLHYYTDFEDVAPKGSIELRDMKFAKESEGSSQKYCFSLKNNDKDLDYLFYCDEESDYKDWTEAISAAMTKDPQPPVKKEIRKSRSLGYIIKKNVGGKAASSALGKKAIKSQTPEEVRNLVKALKVIIEKESKSAKKAQEIEDAIFKVGIKVYFLIDGGKCTIDDMLEAEKPLRKSFEVLIKSHEYAKFSKNVVEQELKKRLAEFQKHWFASGDVLRKMLTPHMKPTNGAKIKVLADYLSDIDRLYFIFTEPTLDDELQELISAAEHYTQFHFYSEKDK